MAERRVSVKFIAEVLGFKRSMEEAAQATEKTKKASEDAGKATEQASQKAEQAAQKHRQALEDVGQAATVGGAAVLAGVGLAVNAYADFDKAMSSVDAATHETAGNMDLLRQAAIDAGADTAFSAVEAAKGIEEMAKAGVSTKDILAGGLDGALALAAAGSLDVGKAAEIAASAMTQFKLSGDQLPHVADLLAAGAGKAQGSVQDLGEALNQSGLVAAQTGLTIEETTGGLAAFASAGLTGSDAGTSFKTMLAALTPNSEAAATAMAELGISAYDSQGNFVGLSEFAGQLKTSLSGLTDEQRNSTLETIFGSDAVRAASVLYEQGAEGVQKWEDAVNDAGYAAETAAKLQDNLAGDLEKLGGSIDTVLIQSGSGANEVLRGMVQGLEGFVDAVGKVPGPVLGAATGVAGLVGGAALLGGGLITVIPKIRDTKDALEVLAPAGSKANTVLSRTGRVAAGAATGLAAVAAAATIAGPAMDKVLQPTGETADALEKFAGEASRGAISADTLNKSFQDLVNHREGVSDFQAAIEGIADPGLWGNIDNILTDTIGVLTLGMVDLNSTSEEARDRFRAFGEELASLDAEDAAKSFQTMAEQTDGSEESLKSLLEYMPEYRKALEDQAQAAGLATDDQTLLDLAMGKVKASTEGAKGAMDAAGAAAEEAALRSEAIKDALEEVGLAADGSVTDIEKWTQTLFNAGILSLSASNASIQYQAAIDAVTESIKTNGTTLDINTEQGRANQSAFNNIASAAMAAMTATAAETLATQGSSAAQQQLQGNLQQSYNDLIAAAEQFGITGGAADELARKALGIPKETPIESWVTDNASTILDGIKGKADGLDGRQVTTTITTIERTIRSIETQVKASGYADDPMMVALDPSTGTRATGGRIPGYADGGRLPTQGPGTYVTDGFLGISAAGQPLARVDAGEWVIRRESSDRYNRELAAINAGTFPKLPGFADGGRLGREYTARELGHVPTVAGPRTSAGMHIEKVEIREQSDPRATFAEFARRTHMLGT